MHIAFLNRKNHFKKYLENLKKVPVMNYDRSKLTEKITSIEIQASPKLSELDLNFFFDYRIFPENILSGYPQWRDEQRTIREGDTILQQVYLPPVPNCSQKVLFGVRIKDVIQKEGRCGFSYETLKGHVECGISYFMLEEKDEKIVFSIQTFSKPGNFITRILGSVFSVPYQTYCTKKALKHVKKHIELQSSHT